jgi:uncharacterized membrane protein YqaE (UPF0057 family)
MNAASDKEFFPRQKMNNPRNQLIIFRFAGKSHVINLDMESVAELGQDTLYELTQRQLQTLKQKKWIRQSVEDWLAEKWDIKPADYYIDLRNCCSSGFIDIHPRIRGGSIKSIFESFFKGIINGFMAIFKPIVKPLIGIANAFFMLVKAITYIMLLLMWFLKFLAWVVTEVLPSIPTDIFGLVRFLAAMLIDAVVGTVMYYFRKLFNATGSTVVGAALTGWDNNPDESATNRTEQSNDEFEETQTTTQNTKSGVADKIDCAGRKCYKTEAGTVPWTVILATVLFPPSGVFMELGLTGWIQILVCLLLTFMFYFPGLIYALIILYC